MWLFVNIVTWTDMWTYVNIVTWTDTWTYVNIVTWTDTWTSVHRHMDRHMNIREHRHMNRHMNICEHRHMKRHKNMREHRNSTTNWSVIIRQAVIYPWDGYWSEFVGDRMLFLASTSCGLGIQATLDGIWKPLLPVYTLPWSIRH